MLPDRVSNPGPLTYESGALPIALRGPASDEEMTTKTYIYCLPGLVEGNRKFFKINNNNNNSTYLPTLNFLIRSGEGKQIYF